MTSAARDAVELVDWLSGPIGCDVFKLLEELHAKTPRDRSKVALSIKRAMAQQPAQLINVALDVFFARLKMEVLGAWTKAGFFLDQTRQQSSHPALAAWHSRKFNQCKNILEIGTGCGSDTAALARCCEHLTTLEIDPVLAEFARYNFALQSIANVEVLNCGLEGIESSIRRFDGIWADPARRTKDGSRIKDPQAYSPPFSQVVSLIEQIDPAISAIKLSASLDRSQLNANFKAEWIGLGDECLELVAWRANQNTAEPLNDCASLADHKVSWRVNQNKAPLIDSSLVAGAFLVEPHSALIRTQALQGFACEHDFLMWDESIAYMLAITQPLISPWYTSFRILEVHKYGDKLLQHRLRELGWGARTEFKKRGFPSTPEEVRARMQLEDCENFGTVVLTRRGHDHYFFLCERLHA